MKIIIITLSILLLSSAWAKKNKASQDDLELFIFESLQDGINEVTRTSKYFPKYLLEGDVTISKPVGANVISYIVEPITDNLDDGAWNNKHGADIYYKVKFTIRDLMDHCHRAQLFIVERRKGPGSILYDYIKSNTERHEKVIMLDNDAISQLTFTNTWDSTLRFFFNRSIIDKENVPCLENNPRLNQSQRGNSKVGAALDDAVPNSAVQSN